MDIEARNELIHKHKKLIQELAHVVAKSRKGPFTRHDLEQEGIFGLWAAAERYDPMRGPFLPFARSKIKAAMQEYARRNPCEFQERMLPGAPQSTSHARTEGALLEFINAVPDAAPLPDVIAIDKQRDRQVRVTKLPRQQRVIVDLILDGYSVPEISVVLDISQRNVRKSRKSAILKLRAKLAA